MTKSILFSMPNKIDPRISAAIKKWSNNSQREILRLGSSDYPGRFVRINSHENAINCEKLLSKEPQDQVISDYIWRLLNKISYISMSPKNDELFEKYYCISKEKKIDTNTPFQEILPTIKHINESSETVSGFADYLSEQAKVLTRYVMANDYEQINTKNYKYMIEGRPGTGKTAFINYLFSKHHKTFDTSKTIYVRVDLNNITTTKKTLSHRLLEKWLRIFSKYYFLSGDLSNTTKFKRQIEVSLQELIQKGWWKNRKKFSTREIKSFIEQMKEIHAKNYKNADFDFNSLISREKALKRAQLIRNMSHMTELVMYCAQAKYGYSHLAIFDGFDRVGFGDIDEEIYSQWCNEINEITSINDNHFYKSVYIITVRDSSIRKFIKANVQPSAIDAFKKVSTFTHLRISTYPTKQILTKRFEYVEDTFKKPATNMLRNILNLLYMCVNGTTPIDAYNCTWLEIDETLRELFALNFRNLYNTTRNLVRLTLFSTKSEVHTLDMLFSDPSRLELLEYYYPIQWRVLRLLTAGTIASPYLNKTSYDETGDVIRRDLTQVIPNIFNFNEKGFLKSKNKKHVDALKCLNKLLCKMYIINILRCNSGKLGVLQIVGSLKKSFCKHWGSEDLIYEIRELISSNILSCELSAVEIADSSKINENYPVALTGKERIVDTLLHSSIYYELTMMDTPIDDRFMDLFQPINLGENVKPDELIAISRQVIHFYEYIKYIENFFIDNLLFESDIKSGFSTIYKDLYNAKFKVITSRVAQSTEMSLGRRLTGFISLQSSEEAKSNFISLIEAID